MEEKRLRMAELHSECGSAAADKAEVDSLLKSTYCLQRRTINADPAPAIRDLRAQWPLLFVQKSLYSHFELLTGVPIRKMEQAVEERGRLIIDYFKSKATNDVVKKVLGTHGEEEVAALIIELLMAHFKEKTEDLILKTEETASAANIERTLDLAESPRLIILGERLSGQKWMVGIEGQVVCEGVQPTFSSGLAALFVCYYNFNLQYQEGAACTLEFIQRNFFRINPERGSKAGRGKVIRKRTGQLVQKKALAINPHVCSLMKKLTEFEWDFI
ncbi:uncharacterized protein LOC118805100 [Colossoma macropomum]|uniref:uncharacterized protein LOC118805100 n=1 Tax=Colossoma macropomum TaxID=42526 RepID=UPI001863EAC2|nr:uncharacterized protein LOC118805100 [Colossoma macropomum]